MFLLLWCKICDPIVEIMRNRHNIMCQIFAVLCVNVLLMMYHVVSWSEQMFEEITILIVIVLIVVLIVISLKILYITMKYFGCSKNISMKNRWVLRKSWFWELTCEFAWCLSSFSHGPRLSDGVRAVPEGSGWLHSAERAGLEREGPPPAALYCCLTLPSVSDWTHHPPGEVPTRRPHWYWPVITNAVGQRESWQPVSVEGIQFHCMCMLKTDVVRWRLWVL